MNKNLRVVNLLVFFAILLGTFFLISALFPDWELSANLIVCNGLMYAAYYFSVRMGWIEKPQSIYRKSVDDPLAHIRIKNGQLCLNDHNIPLAKIKKVVIDKVKAIDGDTVQGLVQLPFNQQNGNIPELWFDLQHVETLQTFLKQHIPELVFIK